MFVVEYGSTKISALFYVCVLSLLRGTHKTKMIEREAGEDLKQKLMLVLIQEKSVLQKQNLHLSPKWNILPLLLVLHELHYYYYVLCSCVLGPATESITKQKGVLKSLTVIIYIAFWMNGDTKCQYTYFNFFYTCSILKHILFIYFQNFSCH